MRWKMKEFIYEMTQDPERRVLFVEGVRDQAFWSKTLQVPRRPGTLIYSISSIECDSVPGGERGRLIWAAQKLSESMVSDRLLFFADADCDRLLNKALPPNTILTDGRDLESYFFLGDCCAHVCAVIRPGDDTLHTVFADRIKRVARPLGILRLASARGDMKLPFRETLKRGLKKFVVKNGSGHDLNVHALLRVLLQNADRSLSEESGIYSLYKDEEALQRSAPDNQIVHGKDLARLIAWEFDVAQAYAEALVMIALATEKASIRAEPNIQDASVWLN